MLKKFKELVKARAGLTGDVRLDNAKTIRYLIKNNLMDVFAMLGTINIMNSVGDILNIDYTGGVCTYSLLINNDGVYDKGIDISMLLYSKNKYGSAILKRFFKCVEDDILAVMLNKNIDYLKCTEGNVYQAMLTNRDGKYVPYTITNIMGDTLRIKMGSDGYIKYVVEIVDSSNTIVNDIIDKDKLVEFLAITKQPVG